MNLGDIDEVDSILETEVDEEPEEENKNNNEEPKKPKIDGNDSEVTLQKIYFSFKVLFHAGVIFVL